MTKDMVCLRRLFLQTENNYLSENLVKNKENRSDNLTREMTHDLRRYLLQTGNILLQNIIKTSWNNNLTTEMIT